MGTTSIDIDYYEMIQGKASTLDSIIKKLGGLENMNALLNDLRELELKICGRLDESEQSELNYLITCVEEGLNAIQKLTNGLEIA